MCLSMWYLYVGKETAQEDDANSQEVLSYLLLENTK